MADKKSGLVALFLAVVLALTLTPGCRKKKAEPPPEKTGVAGEVRGIGPRPSQTYQFCDLHVIPEDIEMKTPVLRLDEVVADR